MHLNPTLPQALFHALMHHSLAIRVCGLDLALQQHPAFRKHSDTNRDRRGTSPTTPRIETAKQIDKARPPKPSMRTKLTTSTKPNHTDEALKPTSCYEDKPSKTRQRLTLRCHPTCPPRGGNVGESDCQASHATREQRGAAHDFNGDASKALAKRSLQTLKVITLVREDPLVVVYIH